MKKLVLLAALVSLSACSKKEEGPVATDTAEATPAAAEGTAPGTYDVKDADGKMAKTVINADGTYVDTDPGGKETRGKFSNKDGKDCFDPDGDQPEVCWTIGTRGADGSFTATTPDGKTTVTVSPAAGAATATTTPAAPAT